MVWRARWTIPKTLFLITRYAPFIDMVVNLYRTSFIVSEILHLISNSVDSLNRNASPEVWLPSAFLTFGVADKVYSF